VCGVATERGVNSSYTVLHGAKNRGVSAAKAPADDSKPRENTLFSRTNGSVSPADTLFPRADGLFSQANGLFSPADGLFSRTNGSFSRADGPRAMADTPRAAADAPFRQTRLTRAHRTGNAFRYAEKEKFR
jgi:hypothetical protein